MTAVGGARWSQRRRGVRVFVVVLALGAGSVLSACGGGDPALDFSTPETSAVSSDAPTVTDPPPAPSSSDVPSSTTPDTTTSTTTSTTTTTTTTTVPETTTTAAPATTTTEPDPAAPSVACASYLGELVTIMDGAATQLDAGADVARRIVEGTLSETDAAAPLAAIADAFADLSSDLAALGEPPPSTDEAVTLFNEALEAFRDGYDLQSRGAAAGDADLLGQSLDRLDAGAIALEQVADALPDCSEVVAADDELPTDDETTADDDATADDEVTTGDEGTEFAVPDETDLTVFLRLAESLFSSTDSPYVGTTPEVLTASAQASCSVLLAGGDIRSAIDAAIAASPVAGQQFGAAEQQYVLLVVTRGAGLWCPDVVGDEEAFTAEVISTIVDVFFEG